MPHATDDETLGDVEQLRNVRSFVDNWENQDNDRVFDQRDKADDAIDYEDVSDDDLPDEEEATNKIDDEDDTFTQMFGGATAGAPNQPAQTHANAYGEKHDVSHSSVGDLFGDADETNDLFGDVNSSPELQRAQPIQPERPQPTHRPSGLALPSKSSLALPGMRTGYRPAQPQQMQLSPESMSPPPFEDGPYSPAGSDDDDDDSDDAGLNEQERMQRLLFKNAARKQAGEDVDETFDEIDMDVFYNLYPGFEKNQNPNFVKLFPPRPGQYRGKVPLKPPRALPITKLSLELMADQEKAFRTAVSTHKASEDQYLRPGTVIFKEDAQDADISDDELALSVMDDDEQIGGVTMQDLAIICGDWDIPSSDAGSAVNSAHPDDEWDDHDFSRTSKKRKFLESDFSLTLQDPQIPFEHPERATAKLAKSVKLDLNDQHLLVDEFVPQKRRKTARDAKSTLSANRSLIKRYNISNDEAYDLLKENHQHKVRSTLGGMTIEHSLPAAKLQFPFYKVSLDGKAKRAFHRPTLDIRDARGREYRFSRPKHVKRKHLKGKETKEIFARAEDLSLGDNSNLLLMEYSEEVPIMLSNFGMGNKLLNYYRKRDADDQERPKREIGETHVLLTQDKSPFANFGHVDRGEIVPTLHNGMFRAPAFQHKPKSTDFVVGISTTYASGHRFYLRNAENLHTVGQQLPTIEVPTRHSRKVTDAAKKRLRALSYRMYTKSMDPSRPRAKILNNENLMPHLPGHDMPQTRSKMREFMKYERAPGKDSGGRWVPQPGHAVPDAETLRGWIKPEDICALDSTQAGVQHLQDLGIAIDDKNEDDDKDLGDDEDIEKKLAPWRATKNFLAACQGKAMLRLYGDGDPTGRGEGFSFVKTSMKGGFKAFGESAEDKIAAKKRRETGGHSYNVAEQQRLYDDSIRGIWNKQKVSLSAELEHSDAEMDDYVDEPAGAYPSGRGITPRSSFATPARNNMNDDSASQFSKGSAGRRNDDVLIITRRIINKLGEPELVTEEVTNQKVISLYRKKQLEKKLLDLMPDEMKPTGDVELDNLKMQKLLAEKARLERNADRREAREKQKGKIAGSPSVAASPAANGSADDATPQKSGRGRTKDGTARKCANCGQVGHIKTNRKSVTFNCLFCGCDQFESLVDGKKNASGHACEPGDGAVAGAGGGWLSSSYSRFQL